MNVCVIPAFNRPEYLHICLEFIQKADGAENLVYIFALDRGANPENEKIINKFPFKKFTVAPHLVINGIAKQSFNVLNGLIAGANMSDELVFYVEDDVFVGKDFFTFSEKIHKKEKGIFCSILSHNVNGHDKTINDLNAYYTKKTHEYCGIGSCYKAKALLKYVLPDFNNDYFKQPLTYVKLHYPKSVLNNSYYEQDGLIRRILEHNGLSVAFAHVPRCFHAGFYGYHRSPKVNVRDLNQREKIKLIKDVVFDFEKLKKISEIGWYAEDSKPVELNTNHTKCYKRKVI